MERQLGLVFATCGILTGVAACDQLRGGRTSGGMRWARAALDRNASLTVLAEDDRAEVFTVRMANDGTIRTLGLSALAAGPAEGLAVNPGGAAASGQSSPEQSLPERRPPEPSVATTPTQPEEPLPAATHETPPAPVAAPGQRVLASSPGYSIAAADNRAPRAARPPVAVETVAPIAHTIPELRTDPIICQGNRSLRVDGQDLQFSGDAITAEAGCELRISNSRIVARGIAISARHANVHVENSTVEGTLVSIDASGGSQIYAQASRFKGLSRRLDSAAMHDLGGNVWN